MNCREDEAAIHGRIAMRMSGKAHKRCLYGRGRFILFHYRYLMETITTAQIQERLAACIRQSGMTQRELAQKLNVTQQCISAYVTGKKLPAPDTLANLCKLLDVEADYILCLKKY